MNSLLLAFTVNPSAHITAKVFGLTVNVDDLVSVAVAGLIIVALGLVLRAKVTSGVPGKLQLAFESIVGFVEGMVLVATPALVRDFSPQVRRGAAMGLWTMGPVLGSLVVTDAYIALVSSGTISDLRILN